MRRRLKHIHARDNTQRWLVSYADYMTLMFALFVVLYAMAHVNDEQYPEVHQRWFEAVENLERHFSLLDKTAEPTTVGDLNDHFADNSGSSAIPLPVQDPIRIDKESSWVELKNYLSESVKDLPFQDDIVISHDQQWLYIELDSRLFFASGSAHLLTQAKQYIAQISPMLANISNYIHIKSYTNSQVIDAALYADNWQLSAQRALRVLDALQTNAIAPQRLAIEAYGPYGQVRGVSIEPKSLVFAISRQEWHSQVTPEPEAETTTAPAVVPVADSDVMQEVPTTDGGVRFTTRQE